MLTFSFLIISLFFPNISKLIVDAVEKECSTNPDDSNSDRGENRPHASTQGKKLNFPCLRQKLEHIMNSEHEIGRTYVGPKFVSVGSTTAKVELQHFFTMNLEPPLSHPSEAVPEDPIPQANMVDPHATLVDQATVINNVYELTSTIPLNGETKLEPILLLTLEAPIRPLASGIGHGVVLMFCTMLSIAWF
ncbi:unnamed protein product [Prunus armeniaca]|uniref:Uncharacterized protein n=1 Tax=Prunus armeniaca TaxID=36596 RepID=A0A6J5XX15_PRUAR|nr:unnamed protein product [Prunus armeniaca]